MKKLNNGIGFKLLFLMLLFVFGFSVTTAAAIRPADVAEPAEGNVFINVDGTFSSAAKEEILNRVNEIRQEAYKAGYVTAYVPITWSASLEKVAQLRAAEADLLWAHDRLSGKKIGDISYGTVTSYGENLAWNYEGMMQGIEQWYEEKDDYIRKRAGEEVSGETGHYENMINPYFKSMGLGCFQGANEACCCVAQELSYYEDSDSGKSDLDGEWTQLIEVKENLLSSRMLSGANSLKEGSSASFSLQVTGIFESEIHKSTGKYVITEGVSWDSSKPAIATVDSSGTVQAVGQGETTISASVGGITASKEIGIGVNNLKYAEINMEQDSYLYCAEAIEPSVSVTLMGNTLTEGTDYTVSYLNNLNAGDASVVLEGKNDYTGQTVTKEFEIEKIVPGSGRLLSYSYIYTGDEIYPEFSISNGTRRFTIPKSDYTATFSPDNINAGTVSMTLTTTTVNFKGNYTYSAISYKIVPASIKNDAVVAPIADQTYTGSKLEPPLSITYNGHLLSYGTDYTAEYSNNVDAGTGQVKITGNGNYKDSTTVTFSINPAPITDFVVDVENQTYTGSALTPNVTVSKGEVTLEAGKDFTVSPEQVKDAGDTTITVSGAGNYTGEVSGVFTVNPASMNDVVVSFIDPDAVYTYTGSAIEPEVQVLLGTVILPVSDYEVNYSGNINAGDGASVTVKASEIGNLTGTSKSLTFKIHPAELADAEITLQESELTYNGSEQKPGIKTVVAGENTLKEGIDFEVSYPDTGEGAYRDKGSYTIRLTGKGNYFGTADTKYTILPESLDGASVTLTLPEDGCVYSGEAFEPPVKNVLTKNGISPGSEDYTVKYEKNINAGTAVAKLSGTGNFTGSAQAEFTISPLGLSSPEIIVKTVDQTFTGKTLTTVVSAAKGETALAEGTDYTISYPGEDYTNAGEVSVALKGIGNYTGERAETFTILPAKLTTLKGLKDKTYNGSEQTQEDLEVFAEELQAKEGVDYSVSYENNTNAGTATVKVKGSGNFDGALEQTFSIAPADLKTSCKASVTEMIYSGSRQEAAISIIGFGDAVLDPTEYTLSGDTGGVDAGDYSFTVTAKDNTNYTGSFESGFTIQQASITDYTVAAEEMTYTGDQLSPEVTVKSGDHVLNAETEYEYVIGTGSEPVLNAGVYNITVSGKGNYTGTAMGTLTVGSASMADVNASLKEPEKVWTYTGNGIEPEVLVSLNGVDLPASDYEVGYSNNINVGSSAGITVKASGNGNLKGNDLQLSFAIEEADITESAVITLQNDAFVYNGSEQKPAVASVKVGDTELGADSDYTVSYPDSEESARIIPGSYTVKVTGKGNYKGVKEKTYQISRASIEGAVITLGIPDNGYIYSGADIEPAVTSVRTSGGIDLTAADYSISYADNKNAGTAKVILTGKGNFDKTAQQTFTIQAVNMSGMDGLSISADDQVYTGAPVTKAIHVEYNGIVLTEGTDYVVSGNPDEDYTNVKETVSVTVAGCGNFTGENTAAFSITAADISSVTVTPAEAEMTYTGAALEPDVTVSLNGTVLPAADYSVEYADNISVGTATITVKPSGNGNLSGDSAVGTFVIKEESAGPDGGGSGGNGGNGGSGGNGSNLAPGAQPAQPSGPAITIPKTVKKLKASAKGGKVTVTWKKDKKTIKKQKIKGYEIRVSQEKDPEKALITKRLGKGKTKWKAKLKKGTWYVWIRYFRGDGVSNWKMKKVKVKK